MITDKLLKELERYGNVHKLPNIIHIAGTNGKGSTINYLSSILQQAGNRVGTFTSPHITCEEERIRINGKNIPSKILNALKMDLDSELTFFEKYLICALRYFEEETDYIIIEAGIGGKHDATNVVEPILTAITNVGLDHQDLLGDTIEEIAKQKSGIQKPGVKTLIGASMNGNAELILKQCKLGASIVEPNYRWLDCLGMKGKKTVWGIEVNVPTYQLENINLAIALALELGVPFKIIEHGIKNAPQWFARYEKFGNIIIDGAHNIDGIEALKRNGEKFDFILFSCLDDRPYDEMVDELKKLGEVFVCDFSFIKKTIDAKAVAKSCSVGYIENSSKFLEELPKDKKCLVTGSLYFVSQIRELLV